MAIAPTTVTFAAPPSSLFHSHLRSCLPPPLSSSSTPPSPLASPLTPVLATVVTPCPLFSALSVTAAGRRRHHRRCPPFLFPKTHHALSPSSSSSSPSSTTRHHSPLCLCRRQPHLSHRRLSPVLSLSFSFVRSTIRLPPLHLSPSISALISSAEHHWPPPSPLYPNSATTIVTTPTSPLPSPGVVAIFRPRRLLASPLHHHRAPPSPPAPSSPCRHRFPSPSPASV